MSYMLLDLFGVNKETRKKVKFKNMQVDCCHSFFGSYCDCIVSDDEGMRLKSKTLYKLFNFGTEVYSIDEFIEKFDEAINNNKKSAHDYFDEILCDYTKRQVIRVETKPGQSLTFLNTSNKYFGYFNCMIERKSKDETVIILHKNNDLKQPILMREVEIIVNRIVRVFNSMGAAFALFDEAVEVPQLKANNWNRILMLNDADVCLTKFKDTPMLCLWVKLKRPISQNQDLRNKKIDDISRDWEEFTSMYKEELEHSQAVKDFLSRIGTYPVVTLLYASKDPVHNHARILQNYLETQLKK